MHLGKQQVGLVLMGVLAAAGLTLLTRWLVPQSTNGWGDTIETANNLLQMAAIVVGGWWAYRLFVRQRHDITRANIAHEIQQIELGSGHRLIRVIAHISNVGNVPLRPPRSSTTVQQVLPLVGKYRERVGRGTLVPNGEYEIDWEVIGEHEIDLKTDAFVLEPGESDRYHMDFVIPAEVSAVQIHTMVYCGGDDAEQYWDATSLQRFSAESQNSAAV